MRVRSPSPAPGVRFWARPPKEDLIMRAVVVTADQSVEVLDVADPTLPGPDGAIIEVDATAICGSDLHLYHGVLPSIGIQPGHEVVGRIIEVGPDVRERRVGDRVLVSAVVGCGHCDQCRRGDPVSCRVTGPIALGTTPDVHGGQAEYLAVPAVDLFTLVIPEGVSTENALLLTDILPTGFLGAQMGAIQPGDTVAIFGMGPVGIMALASAKLYGPSRIIAVDVVPERLARAEAMGAIPVDASGEMGALGVLEATGGLGANVAIEAVGHQQTISDALSCVGPRGRVSMVGVNLDMDFPFPMALAFLKALEFRAAFAAIPSTWANLVPLVTEGRLDLSDVFTHRMGLSEAPEAYRLFDQREDGILKVLLDPKA
ncbi:MAG: alcohol dehydrogenase catalytic domain-containing protein [Actinobacteria bacterium]|nr:alcohol dehydrogenase catalytic domain-containing protein [Actinomycetota bacterium]MSX09309.1 alcohol dehydrogenase catalytic domain-containing protein [Actinomycetota bacterium]MSX68835.1 alcohol dehydrogenase catalytic domain-containing protein [Actinomycetota bacterium]